MIPEWRKKQPPCQYSSFGIFFTSKKNWENYVLKWVYYLMMSYKISIWFQIRASQQTFVGLQDVLKTSSRHALKTSSTSLQRNNFTSSKTSWRRLEDVLRTRLEDVLKTFSRPLTRRLQDVLEDEKLLRWRRTS